MSTFYLLAGAFALILSWAMTGCRVGNNAETNANPDKISGYYETQPQTLTFCSGHDGSTCLNVPTNKTPAMISNVMSNPVALIVRALDTGRASFANPKGDGSTIPIFVDPDTGKLGFIGDAPPEILWRDPGCTSRIYIEQEGATQTGTTKLVGSLKIIGRIAVKIQIINAFEGDCTQTLLDMSACYDDPTKCGGASTTENGNLQALVQATFNPYINAGVMKGTDIPNTTSLAYEVDYQ